MEGFGAPSIGDTPVRLSWCVEGGFQVTLVGPVCYHCKIVKEVISIGVYLEGRHESVHVVVERLLGANICMCLNNLGPIWALVGKVFELLAFEALDLTNFTRLALDIIGVYLSAGQVIDIILHEDDSAGGYI